jgi:hypothetical protein
MNVINDKFKQAVARLSQDVDPDRHEQDQWASTSGAILDSAAHMTVEAFTEQGAFDPEIVEAPNRQARRILLTHAGSDEKIATIHLYLSGDDIFVSAQAEATGRARSEAGIEAIRIATVNLNEATVQDALATSISKLQIEG